MDKHFNGVDPASRLLTDETEEMMRRLSGDDPMFVESISTC